MGAVCSTSGIKMRWSWGNLLSASSTYRFPYYSNVHEVQTHIDARSSTTSQANTCRTVTKVFTEKSPGRILLIQES